MFTMEPETFLLTKSFITVCVMLIIALTLTLKNLKLNYITEILKSLIHTY